jgi:hypothetical protein
MAELRWIFADKPKFLVERWEWPMAMHAGPFQKHAAYIICETPFSPSVVKTKLHAPIYVVIKKYNDPRDSENKGFRQLSNFHFRDLHEAMRFVQDYLNRHPEWCPRII